MEDQQIDATFLDRDFLERTVLKIITENEYAPLMSSPKVSVLIQSMWAGKKTYECDGKSSDYSILSHLS